jgi:hypothetical protein
VAGNLPSHPSWAICPMPGSITEYLLPTKSPGAESSPEDPTSQLGLKTGHPLVQVVSGLPSQGLRKSSAIEPARPTLISAALCPGDPLGRIHQAPDPTSTLATPKSAWGWEWGLNGYPTGEPLLLMPPPFHQPSNPGQGPLSTDEDAGSERAGMSEDTQHGKWWPW